MEFSFALTQFTTPKTLATLAGQSSFKVYISGDMLVIENSRGTTRSIDKSYWDQVKFRRNSLGYQKNMTSMYTDPEWDLPYPTDRIFAPYVAAVMNYLESK